MAKVAMVMSQKVHGMYCRSPPMFRMSWASSCEWVADTRGASRGSRCPSQEQQRLEEGVSHQMEDADGPVHADEHVAELGHRGVRQHLLDVVLLERDRRREEVTAPIPATTALETGAIAKSTLVRATR